jgi:hypothetical protein
LANGVLASGAGMVRRIRNRVVDAGPAKEEQKGQAGGKADRLISRGMIGWRSLREHVVRPCDSGE